MDPDKDVVMIPMGREPIRLQALLAGSIDASQSSVTSQGQVLQSYITGPFALFS